MRETLLDTALGTFVAQGIAATPLRRIAQRAGVTPAMLHYYFGSKKRLVEVLVGERLQPALEPVRARMQQAGEDPAGWIAGFVRGVGEAVDAHPWLPALWVREVLSEGGALREVVVDRLAPRVPVLLARQLSSARAQGRFPDDLDPGLTVVSLLGLTLFPAAGAPIWSKVFGMDMPGTGRITQHALALLEHGLQMDFGDAS